MIFVDEVVQSHSHIYGLVQDPSNSIANDIKLLQSWIQT